MNTYISLLRGINVSGQNKIKMIDLIKIYENAGFNQVKTYIQSGNVVFQSNESAINAERAIRDNIEMNFGYKIPVVVVSKEELDTTITFNPFIQSGISDIKSLHLTRLADKPEIDKIKDISDFKDGENRFMINEKNIYLYCPNGYGKVKINNTFFERKLNIQATTRNWKTILVLAEIANYS